MTKGLRNAIRALYENRGLDPNTYIEDSEEEKEVNHSFNGDSGQQESDEGLSHEDEQEPPDNSHSSLRVKPAFCHQNHYVQG